MSNEQQQEKEVSASQQVLDLKEEIKNLKIELRNREARLSGMEEIFNSLFKNVEVQSSVLYKQINKNLTQLADLLGSNTLEQIQQQVNQLHNIPISQQIHLSNRYRDKMGLSPINIPEEHPPIPSPSPSSSIPNTQKS